MVSLGLTLFPKDTNRLDDPWVKEFRNILERIGATYHSHLTGFAIEHGTVTFNFDNEQVTYDILQEVKDVVGISPAVQQ